MELTAENKSFSKKEWQLFQYVLNQQAEVCSMSIRELADATKTSSTTVLRFCRKFDCEGFSEFKIKLKKTLQKQGKTDRLFKQDKKALHYFFERMDESFYRETLLTIAKRISKAKLLILASDRESTLALSYAQQKFTRLDKIVSVEEEATSIKSVWRTLSSETTLLVFSNKGADPFLESLITECSLAGISTISLTNRSTTSIAKLSERNFAYYYSDNQEADSLSSQIPAIYLVELLFDLVTDCEDR